MAIHPTAIVDRAAQIDTGVTIDAYAIMEGPVKLGAGTHVWPHAHLSGDLATVAHKLSGHLRMVHASDNGGKRDDHLPPGEGKIAWDRFLDQLTRLRFDGSFILEIAGDSDTETVLESARRGRRFLRNLSRRLGRSTP